MSVLISQLVWNWVWRFYFSQPMWEKVPAGWYNVSCKDLIVFLDGVLSWIADCFTKEKEIWASTGHDSFKCSPFLPSHLPDTTIWGLQLTIFVTSWIEWLYLHTATSQEVRKYTESELLWSLPFILHTTTSATSCTCKLTLVLHDKTQLLYSFK